MSSRNHPKNLTLGLAAFVVLSLAQASFAASDCKSPDIAKGAQLFATECGVCHSAKADGGAMMGPNLHGVIGRKSGSIPGFSYSQAMKNKGIVWDEANLQQMITQPQAFVSGTYMPYAGMADAASRKTVACFLSAQNNN